MMRLMSGDDTSTGTSDQGRTGRDFSSIGVVGLGTMGAGIAEVFARNGYAVVGVEKDDRGPRPRPSPRRALDGPRGQARQADRRAAGRAGRPDLLHHRDDRPRGLRAGRRGRGRAARRQAGHLPDPRRDRRGRRRARHQHLVALGDRDRHRHLAPRPRDRRALLQPRAGAEPRRDHPHRRDGADRARRRRRAGPLARQDPGRRGRQGGLHRQRAAVRLPQPRGLDVREQVRHPRGPRRRDAVRLRLPDGTAGAARPDRPRHGVRDPGHDVQAGP